MNNFKKFFNKKVVNISIFVVVSAFIAIYATSITSVKSNSTDNLAGYMWSADDWSDVDGSGTQNGPNPGPEYMNPPGGAGWISVNCTSGGNCASNDYGVTLLPSGYLEGYAWSPNFGWLKFGGLNGFPMGLNTVSDNAKVLEPGTSGCVGPESCVVGWARFCAGAANNSTCGGNPAPDDTATGGWDGWVSLSGTGYGVTLSINPDGTGDFDGYAWGGNKDTADMNTTGTGWIAWSGVTYVPDVAPYVLLKATPNIVPQGGTTVLSWEGYGLQTGNVCTASSDEQGPSDSGWVSPPLYPSANGSSFETLPLNILGDHTYTITCLVNGGGTRTSSVVVTVGINLNFYASPSEAPYPDYKTTLYWSVVPSNTVFTSCTASSVPATNWNGYNFDPNPPIFPGHTPNPPLPSSPNIIDVPLSSPPASYTLTCITNGGASVSKTISVNRAPIPEAGIVFTNSACTPVGGGGFETTLTWSTDNIVSGSCDAETLNPVGVIPWTWTNGADSGSISNVPVPASPAPPTTFKLKCTRQSGGEIPAIPLVLGDQCNASRIVKPHYKEN